MTGNTVQIELADADADRLRKLAASADADAEALAGSLLHSALATADGNRSLTAREISRASSPEWRGSRSRRRHSSSFGG